MNQVSFVLIQFADLFRKIAGIEIQIYRARNVASLKLRGRAHVQHDVALVGPQFIEFFNAHVANLGGA